MGVRRLDLDLPCTQSYCASHQLLCSVGNWHSLNWDRFAEQNYESRNSVNFHALLLHVRSATSKYCVSMSTDILSCQLHTWLQSTSNPIKFQASLPECWSCCEARQLVGRRFGSLPCLAHRPFAAEGRLSSQWHSMSLLSSP